MPAFDESDEQCVTVTRGSLAPSSSPSFASRLAALWPLRLAKVLSLGLGLVGLAAIGGASVDRIWRSTPTLATSGSEPEPQAFTQAGLWLPPGEPNGSSGSGPGALHAPTHNPVQEVGTAGGAPGLGTQGTGGSATPSGGSGGATSAALPGLTADGRVILNTAEADDLRRLPRVGKKRAEQILALRTRLGRFKSPADLLRVRGIGPKMLKQLLPLVVLDPPPAQTPTP